MSGFHLDVSSGLTAVSSDPSLTRQLQQQHFVLGNLRNRVLPGELSSQKLERFQRYWDDLLPDQYMGDGGRYRRRRYTVLNWKPGFGDYQIVPDQRHYQSRHYNPLNGGIFREYQPFRESFLSDPVFSSLLKEAGVQVQALSPEVKEWRIECHQFRINANQTEVGKPTPEGVHQDGVEYVFIVLVNRQQVRGGVSRVYSLEGKVLHRHKMRHPLDFMLVDDHKVFHSVSNIQPRRNQTDGFRDALVMTFKKMAA
jgi:hypothetical protein